ncbi:MAG: TolC family protein, partial [Verrucomicrobiota bacterium]
LLPTISLTGNYGHSTPELEEILNSDFTVWTFASGVAQPIIEGHRLRQTVKQRQAQADAALANYQQTALVAFQEVEEALASESYLQQRATALARAVELSQSALDRARDDYQGGVGDILTLLRAQEQLILSESALIDARRARLDNRIDLHTALGGDFRARD